MLVGSWRISHIKEKIDHVPEKSPVFHKPWFHWQALCRSRFKKYLRCTNTCSNKATLQLISGPTLVSLSPECRGNDNFNAKITLLFRLQPRFRINTSDKSCVAMVYYWYPVLWIIKTRNLKTRKYPSCPCCQNLPNAIAIDNNGIVLLNIC